MTVDWPLPPNSGGGRSAGMVEWVDGSGNTADQLTLDTLIAMGNRLRVAVYGVRLTAGLLETVAAARPREAHWREEGTAWTVTVLPPRSWRQVVEAPSCA